MIGNIEKYFNWIFESVLVMTYELVIGSHVVSITFIGGDCF